MDATLATLLATPSFAILFVWMLWTYRKENGEREKEYQSTIRRQARTLTVMAELLRKCGLQPPAEDEENEPKHG